MVERLAAQIAPPPLTPDGRLRTPREWADANRILPVGSPEAGPWRTDRTPYFVPILSRLSSPHVRQTTVVCGTQQGKTDNLLNVVGWRMDDGPRVPALLVFPTEKLARSISKQRLGQLISTCPSLADRLAKGQADSIMEKFIGGVRLGLAWAGSATELASHPVGLLVVDELDRCPEDTAGEGDPLQLARARVTNYANSLVLVTSTPTIEDASPIQAEFDTGTREFWSWQCPHCENWHAPKAAHLHWPSDCSSLDDLAALATYACPHCGAEITEQQRGPINAAGRYIAHNRDTESGDYTPADREPPHDAAHRSYWISGLASPWRTFKASARGLAAAYQSKTPLKIQAAINTIAGELYRMRGERPKAATVLTHRAGYRRRTIPDAVHRLVMGIDVQIDGLYWEITGIGPHLTTYLLDWGFDSGLTAYDEVWIGMSTRLQAGLADWPIMRCFADSGYRPGLDEHPRPDHAVYTWTRRHKGVAYPTKGWDARSRPLSTSLVDVRAGGQTIKHGVQLWHVDASYYKRQIYDALNTEPPASSLHLPDDVDDEYAEQLVAEEMLVKPSGHISWIARRSRPNHYLDTHVLCRAAATSLNLHKLTAETPRPTPTHVKPQRKYRPNPYARRGLSG